MKNNFLYFIPQNMPFNLYCLCPKRCALKHAQACRLKNYSHFGILLVSFLRNVKYLNASHKNQMVTMVNFCAISWKTQDNALMAKNHSTNFHLPLFTSKIPFILCETKATKSYQKLGMFLKMVLQHVASWKIQIRMVLLLNSLQIITQEK